MPGVTFYDQTGQPKDLTPEAATESFAKGLYSPQKDQRVPVRLKDGRSGFVDGHELSDTLANGAKIIDPEAEAHQAAVDEEKGVAGTIRAASLGLVTGAGLGPGLIRKGISAISPNAGKRFAEDVAVNREANPIVTPAAEAAGFGLSVAATGGLGGAAKAIPAVGIDAIGQLAERGAVKALGRVGGEGVLATAGRAAATQATRGAAEGALITAGASLDEDMLGDHELNAQKAFIAGAKGGALTAAFGGGLGAAGSLVRSARGAAVQSGARDLLHTVADEFETKAETKAAEKQAEGIEALQEAPQVDKDLGKAQDLREVAKSGGFLHDTADEAAWRAGGGNKRLSSIAEQRAGGTKAVGRTVREMGILDEATSHEELLDRTKAKLSELGEEIGNTVGGTQVTVSAKDVLRSVDAAIAPLEKSAATQGDARAVIVLRQDLYKTLGLVDATGLPIPGALEKRIPFQDLVRERRALQGRVYSVGDPNATAMKRVGGEIAGAWNGLESDALEQAAKGSGEAFRALNKQYQQLTIYEKALDQTIAAGHSNHRLGLLDHVAGHGAGMVGAAVAGPFGHVIGGVAGAIMNKMARERGNLVAAKVLGKIADLGAVRSYAQTVDKAVNGAARGLTSASEKTKLPRRVAKRETEKRAPIGVRYREAIKELDEMQAHPQSVAERAMTHTEDLATHAPKTAQAFTMTATRAAAFLQAKRPQALGDPSMFLAQEPSILDTDKAQYVRYHDAVKDLEGVLKGFERGAITPEGAEALKAITPEVFGQLQNKVMQEVAVRHAKGKPMPYKQRLQLGLLFDIDTDPSLDKATFKALQANVYTAPAPEQPKARGGKSNAPRRPVKLPNQANPLDRLAESGAGRK